GDVQRLEIADRARLQLLAQGTEAGIEPPVESEKEARLGERSGSRPRALHAQVDRLLAEDGLARGSRLQAVGKMLIRRAGDDDAGDGAIGQRILQSRDSGAVAQRE